MLGGVARIGFEHHVDRRDPAALRVAALAPFERQLGAGHTERVRGAASTSSGPVGNRAAGAAVAPSIHLP